MLNKQDDIHPSYRYLTFFPSRVSNLVFQSYLNNEELWFFSKRKKIYITLDSAFSPSFLVDETLALLISNWTGPKSFDFLSQHFCNMDKGCTNYTLSWGIIYLRQRPIQAKPIYCFLMTGFRRLVRIDTEIFFYNSNVRQIFGVVVI